MNAWDWLILALVAGTVVFGLLRSRRRRKDGKGCCISASGSGGCAACTGCSAGCKAGKSAACSCGKDR